MWNEIENGSDCEDKIQNNETALHNNERIRLAGCRAHTMHAYFHLIYLFNNNVGDKNRTELEDMWTWSHCLPSYDSIRSTCKILVTTFLSVVCWCAASGGEVPSGAFKINSTTSAHATHIHFTYTNSRNYEFFISCKGKRDYCVELQPENNIVYKYSRIASGFFSSGYCVRYHPVPVTDIIRN